MRSGRARTPCVGPCHGHAPAVSQPMAGRVVAVSQCLHGRVVAYIATQHRVSSPPSGHDTNLYRNLAPAACRIAALVVLYRDIASGHTFSAPLSRYNQLYRDTPNQTVRPCYYVMIQCFVSRPHPNDQTMRARDRPCRAHSRPYCSLPLGRVVAQSSLIVAKPAWPCAPCVTIQSTIS